MTDRDRTQDQRRWWSNERYQNFDDDRRQARQREDRGPLDEAVSDFGDRIGYSYSASQVPGPHLGRGPKGYTRSDQRIREDICDALMMHPHVDASEMEVRVENGEVTLSGSAAGRGEKYIAEELCDAVAGVLDVHNSVRVKRVSSRRNAQATGDSAQRTARASSQGAGGSHPVHETRQNGPRS